MLVDFEPKKSSISIISKIINTYKKISLIRVRTRNLTKDKSNVNITKVNTESKVEYDNFCKTPVNTAVVELTQRFRKSAGYSEENIKSLDRFLSKNTNEQSNKDKFTQFKEYLQNNSTGEKLPSNQEQIDSLEITERERQSLRKEAIEKGLIIQISKTKSILNLNYK